MGFHTKTILARIKPKKKLQSIMGWVSRSVLKSFARLTTLVAIPVKSNSRKGPLIDFHAPLIPSALSVLNRERFMALMLFSKGSYMPDMKAIVPPETPGTTSAAPMAIPLRKINSEFKPFISWILPSSTKLRRFLYEEKVLLLASR